jgi:hypothetical protein
VEKRIVLLFIFIIFSISISFFLSIYAFGLDLIGFLGFGVSLIMTFVLTILFIKKSLRNRKINKIELGLIIISLLGLFKAESYSREFTREREPFSILEGNKIILAIDTYFEETGKYPERIDELRPKYLIEIPKSYVFLTSDDFKYSYWKEKNIYRLAFRRPAYTIYEYRSDYKQWIQTD